MILYRIKCSTYNGCTGEESWIDRKVFINKGNAEKELINVKKTYENKQLGVTIKCDVEEFNTED